MASFYGGCGEVPPQPSGWQRPDASRFINNARGAARLPPSHFRFVPKTRHLRVNECTTQRGAHAISASASPTGVGLGCWGQLAGQQRRAFTSNFSGSPRGSCTDSDQPCNGPDTRHQQQASQPDDTGKEFHRLEPPSIIAVFDRLFLVVSGSRLCCWPACDCCTIVEVFD